MPTSTWATVHIAVKIINMLKPTKVLDIGIGSGKWGFIARELLDIRRGKFQKNEFEAVIDGIEVFPRYISDYHNGIYNQIFIGNALEVVKDIDRYELAIIGDCLEHFKKEDAYNLLDILCNKCTAILIILPLGESPQGICFDNPNEIHQDLYNKAFFKKYPHFFKKIHIKKRNYRGVVLIHHNMQVLAKIKRRFGMLEAIKSLKNRCLLKISL